MSDRSYANLLSLASDVQYRVRLDQFKTVIFGCICGMELGNLVIMHEINVCVGR